MKMKTILIVLGVILVIFLTAQIIYYFKVQRGIESYPYSIVKRYDTFEIRSYEARLFTAVQLSTSDYKKASSEGFSVLAGYIFGGNEKNEKIAMTSPVTMSLKDSSTMMFMVPRNIKREQLPKPNASDIEFVEEPAKTMAAITFGGWANSEKIKRYKTKLINALDAQGIAYKTSFYFFGYNAPFEIIKRRNEVVVELE